MPELLNTETPTEVVETQTETPVENSEQTSDWFDQIPEDFKESSFVQKYGNDKEAFFNGVSNMSKMVGAKTVPDFENDAPEVINAFRDKLGVPHDSTGYNFDLPEGTEKNESFDTFTALAHKGHMPQDVAKEMHSLHVAEVQSAVQAYEATKEAEVDTAFSEFKNDPRFQEIAGNVSNLLTKVDPSGDTLSQDDLANLGPLAPKVARFLDKIVKLTGDDSVIKAGDNTLQGGREEQIQQLFADYKAGRISKETLNARRESTNAAFRN